MDAYIYKAALYCEDCAGEIPWAAIQDHPEWCDDSDCCPQGPYPNGGGEADTPQHCDTCGVFLENPLTDDGVRYVVAALDDGGGDLAVMEAWYAFYVPRGLDDRMSVLT